VETRRTALIAAIAVFSLFAAVDLESQVRIERLDRSDPVYVQHQQMVADYHERVGRGEPIPPMILFEYEAAGDETLFSIASRLMLPYATLATVNRLSDPAPPSGTILIPSQPGIAAYYDPQTRIERSILERLVSGENDGNGLNPIELSITNGQHRVRAAFFPGIELSPEERTAFFRVSFRNPLPNGQISSRYGFRYHPITGVWSFHHGIDLAADFGQPVTVTAPGTVGSIDRDPWLGLTVTVDHANGYSSVYAHLQESLVTVGEAIEEGATIGFVGSTGLSTGPHLHFEVRFRGDSRNPEHYLEWE
jgi:murein DD-endopeptidase MepM/ murein hydrolase activator NlpD